MKAFTFKRDNSEFDNQGPGHESQFSSGPARVLQAHKGNIKSCHWIKTPSQAELQTFRHVRLVTDMVYLHLEDCRTIEDAVTVVRDASIAHKDASKAGTVLRDVSWTNIMATIENGKLQGTFIDWDTCLEIDEGKSSKDKCDQSPERIGTWHFIVARIILNEGPSWRQTDIDDIESFFHVLVCLAALYTAHTLESEVLRLFFTRYFEECVMNGRQDTGGRYKISFLRTKGDDLLPRLTNKGLSKLLRSLASTLSSRYPVETDADILSDFDDAEQEVSEKAMKKLDAMETNPTWLSDKITKALTTLDQEHWTQNGGIVHQRPPRPINGPNPSHQNMSTRATRNIAISGQ
ncbi:hypothetical protein BDN72DRAFT_375858 [Pluteus cervinus]|uniref:Uncharacterized protein n=1 Tax=Pluteus cervinus TaxID=181527 RepID=A0ACD3AA81_9AGAR|nr:hypothetical protein BDN72DRAFT_375858 [Pluteus cervinus]